MSFTGVAKQVAPVLLGLRTHPVRCAKEKHLQSSLSPMPTILGGMMKDDKRRR